MQIFYFVKKKTFKRLFIVKTTQKKQKVLRIRHFFFVKAIFDYYFDINIFNKKKRKKKRKEYICT